MDIDDKIRIVFELHSDASDVTKEKNTIDGWRGIGGGVGMIFKPNQNSRKKTIGKIWSCLVLRKDTDHPTKCLETSNIHVYSLVPNEQLTGVLQIGNKAIDLRKITNAPNADNSSNSSSSNSSVSNGAATGPIGAPTAAAAVPAAPPLTGMPSNGSYGSSMNGMGASGGMGMHQVGSEMKSRINMQTSLRSSSHTQQPQQVQQQTQQQQLIPNQTNTNGMYNNNNNNNNERQNQSSSNNKSNNSRKVNVMVPQSNNDCMPMPELHPESSDTAMSVINESLQPMSMGLRMPAMPGLFLFYFCLVAFGYNVVCFLCLLFFQLFLG